MSHKLPRFLIIILCVGFFVSTALADDLVSYKRDGVKVQLKRFRLLDDDLYELEIKAPNFSGVKVFEVQSPSRIVLDLEGTDTSIQKELPVLNDALVKNVRIGAHPNRLRLVLDIDQEVLPPYTWKKEAGSIKIAFGGSSQMMASLRPKTPAHQEKRAAAVHKEELPIEAAPIKPGQIQLEQPQPPSAQPIPSKIEPLKQKVALLSAKRIAVPKKAAQHKTVKEQAKSVKIPQKAKTSLEASLVPVPGEDLQKKERSLEQIGFIYLEPEGTPTTTFQLSQKPKFSIVKNHARRFTLKIEDCVLSADQLSLPNFPPHDFVGLNLVSAQQVENGVHVALNVERGTRLTAFTRENTIFVRSLE